MSCLWKKHTQGSTSVHMRPKVDWKWLKPSCSDKKNTHCKLFGTAKAQQQMWREKQTTQPENPVMKNPKNICWPFQYEILIFLISVWYPPKVRLKLGWRKHWQNIAKSDLLKAICVLIWRSELPATCKSWSWKKPIPLAMACSARPLVGKMTMAKSLAIHVKIEKPQANVGTPCFWLQFLPLFLTLAVSRYLKRI